MAKKVKKTETVVVDVTPTVEVKTENRGRKVNPTSARQMRLAAQNAKKAAGIDVKRGRPVNGESARQKRMAEIEAKKAAGIVVKRGRPKKVEPVVEDTAKAE